MSDNNDEHRAGPGISRRGLLKGGAAGLIAGAAAFPAADAWGKSEKPVKIGMIDPRTGTYASSGENEIRGAKMAVAELNKGNGILGRPAQLLIEDSAANVGQSVQKARKLVNRNKVNFLMGAVSSAVALSVSQTAHDLNTLYVVTGGHADAVTGKKCSWNTFRTCSTTWMLTAGDFEVLFKKYGKRWYFLTPDYAFGHALVRDYTEQLKKAGGTVVGNALSPLGTTDFSSYLIKAKSANPDVLVVLVQGNDMVNALKQATQFGLNKDMAIAGSLLNYEDLESLPDSARYGWWVMEWYWQQPGVPHVKEFVERYRKLYDNKVPTSRSWFGYASAHAIAMACNKAKTLDTLKVVKAMEGLVLPPEVALQPNKVFYRAGDHQMLANMYPGQVKSNGKYPNLFDVADIVPSSSIAKSVASKGCNMKMPSST